jgi:hypothetical protein
MPPISQNFSCKTKKTNLQSFSDCRSGWSKEPQWENDYGSFLPCLLLVMETLTSSPPEMKNGPFSEKFSPHASYFSPVGLHSPSPFSEKATKGCHTFLHGEAILLAPLFPHSPFSENSFSDLREGVTTPYI